jgi:hypothetical protein
MNCPRERRGEEEEKQGDTSREIKKRKNEKMRIYHPNHLVQKKNQKI